MDKLSYALMRRDSAKANQYKAWVLPGVLTTLKQTGSGVWTCSSKTFEKHRPEKFELYR